MTPEQITALITSVAIALPALGTFILMIVNNIRANRTIAKVDSVVKQNSEQSAKLDALAVTTDATHVAVNGEKAQMKQDIKMLQDRVEGLIQRNADLSHKNEKKKK